MHIMQFAGVDVLDELTDEERWKLVIGAYNKDNVSLQWILSSNQGEKGGGVILLSKPSFQRRASNDQSKYTMPRGECMSRPGQAPWFQGVPGVLLYEGVLPIFGPLAGLWRLLKMKIH